MSNIDRSISGPGGGRALQSFRGPGQAGRELLKRPSLLGHRSGQLGQEDLKLRRAAAYRAELRRRV